MDGWMDTFGLKVEGRLLMSTFWFGLGGFHDDFGLAGDLFVGRRFLLRLH